MGDLGINGSEIIGAWGEVRGLRSDRETTDAAIIIRTVKTVVRIILLRSNSHYHKITYIWTIIMLRCIFLFIWMVEKTLALP